MHAVSTTLPTRVDAVTFEILRHRLWSINEEAGHTLERVSGSLIASEVHDMNTSIMNARGDSPRRAVRPRNAVARGDGLAKRTLRVQKLR